MHPIDIGVFILYFGAMLGIGIYFYRKNNNIDEYYVGGRSLGKWHIGLSVVATDVGGGFSIGLGGLGFAIGLSGSWMLFTGLIGAWLSSVLLIPVVSRLSRKHNLFTFPEMLKHYYNNKVALVAGIISALGYIGFTGSQLLAGAKLASATFPGVLSIQNALLVMGLIAIIYTGIGGLKAVIYTDTVQWIILIVGLFLVGIPIAYTAIGGFETIKNTIDPAFLTLSNVSWQTIVNWAVTIIPIWFVGMTLYQRIYASKSEKEAKKAWYIAGLFEWPIMAFMGVILGLFSRVAFENNMFAGSGYLPETGIDPEMGLPVLLNTVLPVGLMGLMLSAYFSAILSTADSCLIAASGNVNTDILRLANSQKKHARVQLWTSQLITIVVGVLALLLANYMKNVLELMLYSYAFMVSGLLIPVLAALFWKSRNSMAALWSMLIGGSTTIILILLKVELPFNLDAILYGISVSAITFYVVSRLSETKY